MLTANQIRAAFLDFFKEKGHLIVPSAPVVVKNDPTLLFINAGMNPFKDAFLGNSPAPAPRVADTQKCLRVSGKHNDLEEVGVDTYHHTLFEMLGNWSFGDYFKKEALAWSWELLTEVYGIPKEQLYVTVFGGDEAEGLAQDTEAYDIWKQYVPEERILFGNKKDNFWEMGDTGPCGPCSEIHVDCRTPEERAAVSGASLVNADHPQVIEIWNNVFMQFNRVWADLAGFTEWQLQYDYADSSKDFKKDRAAKILECTKLVDLPQRHVDTGMGLERLVRVLQQKQSNYDTDLFSGTIAETGKISGKTYDGSDSREAIAFRVLADHIRAISFTIADGQLPSNTGAGYVIRRILRRAVRYYFSYLNYKQPLLHQLVPQLATQFEGVFPELKAQEAFVARVIREEEETFLRTLENGLKRVERLKHDVFVKGLTIALNEQGIRAHREAWKYNKSRAHDILVERSDGSEFIIEVHNRKSNSEANDKPYITADNSLRIPVIDVYISDGYTDSVWRDELEALTSNINLSPETFILSGREAFELYDTYGFPIDLTRLILSEQGLSVDEPAFEAALKEQKDRSRAATALETDDWQTLAEGEKPYFTGYESLSGDTQILRFRKVKAKGKEHYQIVLAETPFYAESGGQVGDTGTLTLQNGETISIFDTKKENDLIVHLTAALPEDFGSGAVRAEVTGDRRQAIAVHHSATHLLHAALRQVLGTHVAQKGSLVNNEYLRFDFSHFAKLTDEEIAAVERIVNEKIRQNIPVQICTMPKEEALKLGAMALFGEKYADDVRVVTTGADYSVELCGGTHVGATGELGFFKIKSEGAVAAGVRRIEALSGAAAEQYVQSQLADYNAAKALLKNPKQLDKSIEALQEEATALRKALEAVENKALAAQAKELAAGAQDSGNFVGKVVEVSSADSLRKLATDVEKALSGKGVVVLCAVINGKLSVAIAVGQERVSEGLDASAIMKTTVAPLIKGGGGGNKTLATAGGANTDAGEAVIAAVREKSL